MLFIRKYTVGVDTLKKCKYTFCCEQLKCGLCCPCLHNTWATCFCIKYLTESDRGLLLVSVYVPPEINAN